jgi:3-hydroxyacyl-CoA dehydrogenase
MLNTAIEHVRWLADWGRQDHGATQRSLGPRKIGSVGIVGAGMMGTGIAATHIQYRLPVVIYDVNPKALAGATARIAAELHKADAHLTPSSFRRLVRPTADLAEAARCDLVLEAIAETLSAKLQLFAQLQPHLGEQTIVASNTSTIPLQQLARGLSNGSRFCGLHFCHPVQQRLLVEIVCGPQTSDLTIAAAVAHVRRIDRIPMVVQDGPGFVINRLLFPYLGEALEMLREGVPAECIEQSAAEFGMSIGPLRLIDEIGLDTALQAAWVLAAAFPKRVVSSPLLVSLIKAGRLGRKTGAGFFSYHGPAVGSIAGTTDKAVAELIAPWIQAGEKGTGPVFRDQPSGASLKSDLSPSSAQASPRPTSETVTYRLVLPMVLEATRILEEGKVGDVRDIDLAVLFGLGFPAAKGGLLWWADTLGAERIIALLQSFSTMGARAEPTLTLKNMARSSGKFYLGEYLPT